MEKKPSLRVKKTARTRAAIVSSASTLFDSQGYDSTTLEQIAELADVHKQTVLRYFRSKEEIALAFRAQAIEDFEAGLFDPERKSDVIGYWRDFAKARARELAKRGDQFKYDEFLRSDPKLFAHSLALEIRYEDALARALALEAGTDPDKDAYSTMLACFLVAGSRGVARLITRSGSLKDLEPSALRVVDYLGVHFTRPKAKAVKQE
jgi:AcrR family transcriptional regulator